MSYRIVDLTLPFREGMRGVHYRPTRSIAVEGSNATTLELLTHAATHLDAPVHYLEGAPAVDQVDLRICMGPARVLNLTSRAGSAITVADLARCSPIAPGSRLLVRTDWDAHAFLPDYRENHPALTAEAARWLVLQGVALIGLDAPSAGPLLERPTLAAVHRTLLSAGVVIVESLANLGQLRQDRVLFVALPLRLPGIDGSPVRAIAVEGDTSAWST